jgi:phosphodiesterase/alkaline phosphatase D-like protein
MKTFLLGLVITAATSSLLSIPMVAQVSQSIARNTRVRITQGPELEMAKEHLTIIRWVTNNPGGSPVHHGIVRYGTDPKNLSQIAKNPIRLNAGHSSTTFRVRMEGLKPGTTYYYTVDSEGADGTNDGVKSMVKQFTTDRQPGTVAAR